MQIEVANLLDHKTGNGKLGAQSKRPALAGARVYEGLAAGANVHEHGLGDAGGG